MLESPSRKSCRTNQKKKSEMLTWLFNIYQKDERINSPPPIPIQTTAVAFIASLIADANMLTDWLYYRFISDGIGSQDVIPGFLVTCTCGTLSYPTLP